MKNLRMFLALARSILLILSLLAQSNAQQKRPIAPLPPATPSKTQQPVTVAMAATVTQTRPRLLLLIVVDQFRYDYLERFGDLFVRNGLGRLLGEGASWANANYDHAPTKTAPG
ncbi:MAG TPA: hypothetical protein VF766_01200, partial [Pyrinomonadaceae bacterium]